jgi:hypothetical protein
MTKNSDSGAGMPFMRVLICTGQKVCMDRRIHEELGVQYPQSLSAEGKRNAWVW